MRGIDTPGQALESGGKAFSLAPRGGVSHLAFPALAREWNQRTASAPLASLGNEVTCTDLHVNRMQAILLHQFRAWHELGPKDGSGSGPLSVLTAKPYRLNPE